ncbi:12568_t:CDS:2 [Entrophospora sp. SA101]|nr:12568_t:CDS:2 [Entrophospora sp. SA101]
MSISISEAEINTRSSSAPSDEMSNSIIPLTTTNVEDEMHRAAIKILQQSIDLLINLSNDENFYIYQSKFIPQSSIGKHIRQKRISEKNKEYNNYNHPLDNYEKKGLNWIVDYDNRVANEEIETSCLKAVKLIRQLQSVLINDSSVITLPFPTRVDSIIDSDLSVNSIQLNSTYGRELWFCCHHAIHHYALIKVICIELNIQCPKNFGVAPSTLRRCH